MSAIILMNLDLLFFRRRNVQYLVVSISSDYKILVKSILHQYMSRDGWHVQLRTEERCKLSGQWTALVVGEESRSEARQQCPAWCPAASLSPYHLRHYSSLRLRHLSYYHTRIILFPSRRTLWSTKNENCDFFPSFN